jgi:hypothetical protein
MTVNYPRWLKNRSHPLLLLLRGSRSSEMTVNYPRWLKNQSHPLLLLLRGSRRSAKTLNYHGARELQQLTRPHPDTTIPQVRKDVKLLMSEMTVN